jgi:hypothetical protein
VLVGLQLPEGGRVQANFPANTRLWDVLLQFEQQGEGKLNLTKRVAAGTGDKKRKADEPAEGYYMLPALTYMQREVCTRALSLRLQPLALYVQAWLLLMRMRCFVYAHQVATVGDLYRNTLQDLGLDGNGLLRLNFRPTEITLESVQVELEAIRASETQRQEEHKKAEEEKAKRKAAEEDVMKRLQEESEKTRDAEREELLRRGREEDEAEEEKRKNEEIERRVAEKEKEMEETFKEMKRAAYEQTQAEHLRVAMRSVSSLHVRSFGLVCTLQWLTFPCFGVNALQSPLWTIRQHFDINIDCHFVSRARVEGQGERRPHGDGDYTTTKTQACQEGTRQAGDSRSRTARAAAHGPTVQSQRVYAIFFLSPDVCVG